MAVLLLGYDVECTWKRGITNNFLKKLKEIHEDLEAPCSIFITGQALKKNGRICQELRKSPLFDFQQHTYSHIPFKPVLSKKNGKVHIRRGAPLEKIKQEVSKTNDLLRRILAVDCIGLTTPYGYYGGLDDRPDVLLLLRSLGIRFTRSYGTNEEGRQPVSLDIQPFWYRNPEVNDILEFPIQGWQDCIWRETYGWQEVEPYLMHLKSNIDVIKRKKLAWCCLHHDWSSLRNDPNMTIIRKFIAYAKEREVQLMTYKAYYEMEFAKNMPF